MKKKFCIISMLSLSSLFIFFNSSTNVNAMTTETSSTYNQQERMLFLKPTMLSKTITDINAMSYFPRTTNYYEYNSTFQAWYSGDLILQSTQRLNNNWYQATYSGVLFLVIQ